MFCSISLHSAHTPTLFTEVVRFLKNHRRSRFPCKNGGRGISYRGLAYKKRVSKHCFSLIMYGFCSSNAHYLESLSFRIFFWLFDFFNFATWVYFCVYKIFNWADIVEKVLPKAGGLEKRIKRWEWPYRRGVSVEEGIRTFCTLWSTVLLFSFCASIFRWTQLILPLTFGYKLFPFLHYILQIGIYIFNVTQGYFTASFQVFDLPVSNIMGAEL